jgi:hypothetical protein
MRVRNIGPLRNLLRLRDSLRFNMIVEDGKWDPGMLWRSGGVAR